MKIENLSGLCLPLVCILEQDTLLPECNISDLSHSPAVTICRTWWFTAIGGFTFSSVQPIGIATIIIKKKHSFWTVHIWTYWDGFWQPYWWKHTFDTFVIPWIQRPNNTFLTLCLGVSCWILVYILIMFVPFKLLFQRGAYSHWKYSIW